MNYFESVKELPIKEDAYILGIETSCDETCAAVLKNRKILSNEIASSAKMQAEFGGVVPEIASRMHTTEIDSVVKRAIEKAGIALEDIDAVAVTYGAGLVGALLVGVSYAKALAYALNKPLIPVSHIRGHLSACYLESDLKPPFLSLLASGGHTAIIHVKDYYDYEILGGTLDDAVGEAFDKVARVLGLSYPGGPNIERLAKMGENVIPMPKMLKNENSYNFSYSGLKTAVINYVHTKEQKGEDFKKENVACSFQCAAINVLVEKLKRASKELNVKTICAGGGVVANGYLRESLEKAFVDCKLILPPKPLCTDNASMIAMEGYLQYLKGNFAPLSLNASATVKLGN